MNQLQTWVRTHHAIIISVSLSVLLGISLVGINSTTILAERYNIPSFVLFLAIIALNAGFVTALGYLQIRRRAERFMFIVTLTALLGYIFLYYVRLSSTLFGVGSTVINSRLIATLGVLLIYGSTIYYLLRHEVLPFFIRAAVAFLVLLSTFSFFSFVADNSRSGTLFAQDVLNFLINQFNVIPWLILAGVALACITRADLNFRQLKIEIPTLVNLAALNIIGLLAIFWIGISSYGVVNIFYWQQAFMGFILWDMSYQFITKSFNNEESNFGFSRNWKDILYYSVLLAVVIVSTLIFSYLPTNR